MVIAEGTPEDVAASPASYTGQFLKPLLDGRGGVRAKPGRGARKAPAAKAPAKKTAAKKTAKRPAAKKVTRKSA
jgi:excinuclease ABC subunit A